MAQQFFFDNQIRRFLLQFTRMVSNFQVEYGRDADGNVTLLQVPVRYGDVSRHAQTIIQENSANNMPAAPMMTFYITGLDYERDRIQEPHHISKMHVRQRQYDPATGEYSTAQGNAFTIEKPMPVPYRLTINLDLWTTSTNQKFQLVEQISTLFNPSLEIQSTDNFIDWTSLSVVELERTNWSSRSIPVGTDNPIDIFTYQFYIPIWLSPPARVKKLGVVNKIIASIYDAKGDSIAAIQNNDLLMGTRMQITPYGWQALLVGNQLRAIKTNTPQTIIDEGGIHDDFTSEWKSVIEPYGVLRDGISLIRLFNDELGTEISGSVAYNPLDPKSLLFTLDEDSKPSNTLQPIDAIINPEKSGPGTGLPVPNNGTRYLLVNSIGASENSSPAAAWGAVVAAAGDIIEWSGSEWIVAFDASASTEIEYVTNITTGTQYIWCEGQWAKSFEGVYPGGQWTVVL